MVKTAKFIGLAILTIFPVLMTHSLVRADASPAAAASSSLPPKWDPQIPLPPGAVLVSSAVPKTGVVYGAEFSAPGNYADLVSFYEKELPKAGFGMGPKVAIASRKVYNRAFNKGDMSDSVVITPNEKDPSKFTIRIAWTPEGPPAAPEPGARKTDSRSHY